MAKEQKAQQKKQDGKKRDYAKEALERSRKSPPGRFGVPGPVPANTIN